MRRPFILCGILILLVEMLAWSQQTPRQRLRRQQMQQVPHNASDFSPDPSPVPTPTPDATAPPRAQAPMPQAAAPPAAPLATPAQPELLPAASPPQVSFRNGLLTVQAINSTLGSLLVAIRNKTGIQFEGLENGAPEHVAITMGPAPEGDVLATILAGSGFDYVVMERPDTPGIVQRVVLTPKGATASSAVPPPLRAADADADDDEDTQEANTPQDTPVRPPVAQLPAQQPQPTPQQQVPTPDQLLQKLKQLPPEQTAQPQPQTQAPLKQPQNAPSAQPPKP